MELLIWVGIIGLVLVIVAGMIALFQATKSKEIGFLSNLTLTGFAFIFLGAGGLMLTAFFILFGVQFFTEISTTVASLASFGASIGGAILGLGVSLKVTKKRKSDCLLDPNCQLDN